MHFEILTIFPEIFSGFLSASLINKAIEKSLLSITLVNIRDFSDPPHYKVDDTPYGGGAGMVMKPEPLARAIEAAKARCPDAPVILFSAAGRRFTQERAQSLSEKDALILVCGRYEGVDQRVIDLYVDEELSIGDYVLMGGEVPAMVLMEATARLRSSVLGNAESITHESFSQSSHGVLLEGPQYTRPPEFQGRQVPEILLSGDHQRIASWRQAEGEKKTRLLRPDLIKKESL